MTLLVSRHASSLKAKRDLVKRDPVGEQARLEHLRRRVTLLVSRHASSLEAGRDLVSVTLLMSRHAVST